jgi:ubiquitin thioesterase protein OTUB1
LETAEDIASFCAREVEPMGRECEQLQIIALCEFLGAKVKIEYLDGEPFDGHLNAVDVNMDSSDTPAVTLLFRPGHYDILYK